MYSLIWRLLPGPLWFKLIGLLLLIALVLGVLFTWVFPWLNEIVNNRNVTVEVPSRT